MPAYYNENDPFAAQWLRNLIAAGHIAPGDVDARSIVDVKADDLEGYEQAHFFAGIGGWSVALRLAGWGDDRPVWTGSCPCQPFSGAGERAGFQDERDLWPAWFELIRKRTPTILFGEQVTAATIWLDRVFVDLEGQNYAVAAAILPACAVDAPHRRDRLWFVADASSEGRQQDARGAFGDEVEDEGRSPEQHHIAASAVESVMAHAASPRPFPAAQAGIHRGEEGTGPWNVEFHAYPVASHAYLPLGLCSLYGLLPQPTGLY